MACNWNNVGRSSRLLLCCVAAAWLGACSEDAPATGIGALSSGGVMDATGGLGTGTTGGGTAADAAGTTGGTTIMTGGTTAVGGVTGGAGAVAMPTGGDATMAGGDADPMAMDDGSSMMEEEPASATILPPVDSVEEDGPFPAMTDTSGPHWVWRPTELGQDGVVHPIFVWGTGATATPSAYDDFFIRFATHGFVVVAPTPANLTTSDMQGALEWIIAQNEDSGSPYYQKLDTTRIAMGGHSQGSVETFNVEGMEDRLKTTIHIAGGSFDGAGSSKVKTPTAYICGETDFALSNCMRDFENVEGQPTFFAVLDGVDHVGCARSALPGMISWLRWHLADETEREADFTGPGGQFFQGIWKSETKNWTF